MQFVRVHNATRDIDLATRAELAGTTWTRFMGLMGRRELPAGYGLLIRPCNSIHMFFMRISLDIVYCGAGTAEGDPVLRVLRGIKPWRIGPIVRGSKYVIELPVDAIAHSKTAPGDMIQVFPADIVS